MLERLAFEILHGDEEAAAILCDFVNRADVGMIQGGSGAGFTAETLEGRGVFGHIVGEKLQGNRAAEIDVFGFVDDAHSAAAKLLENAEVGDRCAWDERGRGRRVGHRAGILTMKRTALQGETKMAGVSSSKT
jgi:hypothetical protein